MPRTTRIAAALAATLATIGLAVSPAVMADPPPDANLVEVAIAVNADTGEFSTLIAAVLAADPVIAETLTAPGRRTVFAPTDAAFAELGLDAGNVGSLPTEFLTAVLAYHVTPGARYATSVVNARQLRMLAGGFLYKEPGTTLVDNLGRPANIVLTDVAASNGVIHAIDAVVLPFAP